MAGLYIHIPFCIKKCSYCDFVSFADCADSVKSLYADRAAKEIEGLPSSIIETVFVGGGTPTALKHKELERILDAVLRHGVASDCEITVEANPETITDEYAKSLKAMGVNRISMGLQSADDRLLCAIGRVHSYKRFLQAYDSLRNAGFDNINADIMYGLPGQSGYDFEETVQQVLALEPEHISAYALTLAEGTPMYEAVSRGELTVPEAADIEASLSLLSDVYHRYEISNYAKADRECRHNLNYWQNGYYYGVGCGAHGCVTPEDAVCMGFEVQDCEAVRTAHTSDLQSYLSGARSTADCITRQESMFETVMLGLRMVKGIDESAFKVRYGTELYSIIGGYVKANPHLIYRENGCIRLTNRGMDIQNTVLVDLLDCFEK